MDNVLKNFVIYGDGLTARFTALWLQKLLNDSPIKVCISLVSPQNSTLPTLDLCLPPYFKHLLPSFGLEENEILKFNNLSFNLGTRFSSQMGPEQKVFFQTFEENEMLNSYPFLLQHWIQERLLNLHQKSFDFCFFPQKNLFEKAKVPKILGSTESNSLCQYGLNFKCRDLLNYLDTKCQEVNIQVFKSDIKECQEKESGDIEKIILSDKTQVELDLLLNCHPSPSPALSSKEDFDFFRQDPEKHLEFFTAQSSLTNDLKNFTDIRLSQEGFLQSFQFLKEQHVRFTCKASLSETKASSYLLKTYNIDLKKHPHQWHLSYKHKFKKAWQNNIIHLSSAFATSSPLLTYASFTFLAKQLLFLSSTFPRKDNQLALSKIFNYLSLESFNSIEGVNAFIMNHSTKQELPYPKAFANYLLKSKENYGLPIGDPKGLFSRFFIDSLIFNYDYLPDDFNPLIKYSHTKKNKELLMNHLIKKYQDSSDEFLKHSEYLLRFKPPHPQGSHA
ncbi:hypothetical protein AB751O23_AC_00230 [Chlamydiales bacterium SCGC AB-751-O23]|nr:hypothetical protein AB751O23_AC_00230 [Chlamydiales bacterium SCGC AB-751-O23]